MEKFKWYLEKGRIGKKHKGLKKIAPDIKEADGHIEKALHNLRAMEILSKEGFDDWVVSAAFYAMYHSALAILYELGYESRNQECTFTALEHFIDERIINLDKDVVWIIRKTGETVKERDAKTLREDFQYGVETKVEPVILKELRNNAKEVVQKMRIVLEELRSESD